MRRRGLNKSSLLFGRSLLCAQRTLNLLRAALFIWEKRLRDMSLDCAQSVRKEKVENLKMKIWDR